MIRTLGLCVIILAARSGVDARAQNVRPPRPLSSVPREDTSGQRTIALTVPEGTPLQVALDREIRVKKVGQSLRGYLVQPVYTFDRIVLSLGTRVLGHISKIGRPGGKQLTWSILNADFSPPRPVEVSYDRIVLANGAQIPLRATWSQVQARSSGWLNPRRQRMAGEKCPVGKDGRGQAGVAAGNAASQTTG
jgi:hypothetical protein